VYVRVLTLFDYQQNIVIHQLITDSIIDVVAVFKRYNREYTFYRVILLL